MDTGVFPGRSWMVGMLCTVPYFFIIAARRITQFRYSVTSKFPVVQPWKQIALSGQGKCCATANAVRNLVILGPPVPNWDRAGANFFVTT